MALTLEDLTKIVEAAVRAALAAKGDGGVGQGGGGGRLDERHFRRMDKFSGTNWKEFSFQFRTAAGSANGKAREALDDILKHGKSVDWEGIFVEWKRDEVEKAGAEIYAALSSLTVGEAMTVVRGVPSGNGWEAWSRLFTTRVRLQKP